MLYKKNLHSVSVVSLLFIVLSLAGAETAAAATVKCSDVFALGFKERLRRAKKEYLAPQELLNVEHLLHPKGRIRLVELKHRPEPGFEVQDYTLKIVDAIQKQIPEAEFNSKDTLLTVDVLGERNGLFRTIAFKHILRQSFDMVGVQSHMINYRASTSAFGEARLVFIIKANAKDYREPTGAKFKKLETASEFSDWIATELHATLSNLFINEVYLNTKHSSKEFLTVYELLSKRPNTSFGDYRHQMSKSEFQQAYNAALPVFMQTLKGLELLHIRPSFWDSKPAPDAFAKEIYALLQQGQINTVFESAFSEQALSLRQRLYGQIHKSSSPSMARVSSVRVEDNTTAIPRKEQDPVLSGPGTQVDFGSDFFTGPRHQNTSVTELRQYAEKDMEGIIEKLENVGITELTQLSFANASDLINKTNFSMGQVIALARELSQYGVYLRYPPSVFYQMTSAERAELRPPYGQVYKYNSKTNTYFVPENNFD